MVIHHTDCGLQTATDEGIRTVLGESAAASKDDEDEDEEEVEKVLKGMKFGSFEDPEVSVREDVEFLRESVFFRGMSVVGCVMDTETGSVRVVEVGGGGP